MARWLVVHGHLDRVYTRLPARLGVSSFMVLMLPSIALLYWVEKGTHYTNRVLFTSTTSAIMVALVPALLLAARPQPFPASPLRSVAPGWASAATASTSGTSRSSWPSTSAGRSSACRRSTATGGGCRDPRRDPGGRHASYHLVERPGMEYGRKLAKRVSQRRKARAATA